VNISEEKINEVMRSTQMSYSVQVCNVAPAPELHLELKPVNVTSTSYGEPVFTDSTRDHLLRLRHDIETSGVRLMSDSELEREIGEMRGR
jgi:hypothetical protein